MRAIYRTTILAAIGLGACTFGDGVHGTANEGYFGSTAQLELTTLGLRKLLLIEDKTRANFTSRARECTKSSKVSVEDLPPTKILYGKKPHGTYDSATRQRKIDFDVFENGSDQDIIKVNSHESLHDAEIACMLIDREKFEGLYSLMKAADYPIKDKVEKKLKLYDPKHADIIGEKIAYTMQFWMFDFYGVPKDMEEMFRVVLDESERWKATIVTSGSVTQEPAENLENLLSKVVGIK